MLIDKTGLIDKTSDFVRARMTMVGVAVVVVINVYVTVMASSTARIVRNMYGRSLYEQKDRQ